MANPWRNRRENRIVREYTDDAGNQVKETSFKTARIDASAPMSAYDAKNKNRFVGRLTDEDRADPNHTAWDQFFKKGKTPSAESNTGISLFPTTPANASAMTEFLPKPEFASIPQMTSTLSASTPASMPQVFGSRTASTVPALPRPAVSGDSILTKYGTGSVSSEADWMLKLRRMAQSQGISDFGI